MSDANEMILQILVYKCPLSSWQLTPQLFFNHQFVVFETQNWWWSIEKDEATFLIQRSENLSNVQNFFGKKPRIIPLCHLRYDKGQKSVKDLIHFLHDKNGHIKNVLTEGSCKDFAKIIFDEFAETKFHGIVFGASWLSLSSSTRNSMMSFWFNAIKQDSFWHKISDGRNLS